jgi:ubiquinone/menaquinone biosynthesis C-methylase UbiE
MAVRRRQFCLGSSRSRMGPMDTPIDTFSMPHAVRELERLAVQARNLAAHTAVLFRRAGIRAGHRVLDLGCGPGDVALIAAEIVGPGGHVVGVDRSPAAVAAARDRARLAGHLNVTFKLGDVSNLTIPGEFDVIVGRLVLVDLQDPMRALRDLRKYLRPQGLMVLQETAVGAPLVSVLHHAGYHTQGICIAPPSHLWQERLLGVWARLAGDFRS